MLVADDIVREQESKKVYILGTFDQVHADKYPIRLPRLCLYVALTDLQQGNHDGAIRGVYLDEDQTPVFEAKGTIPSSGPLQVLGMVFKIGGLVFTKEGALEIAFEVDGCRVGARPFQLLRGSPEKREDKANA